jgi:hypothetical protein
MAMRRATSIAILLVFAGAALAANDGIPAEQFAKLRTLIRPQDGESNWRNVEWLTSLHEARLKAASEGKPILLWSGGGAPPLGGC